MVVLGVRGADVFGRLAMLLRASERRSIPGGISSTVKRGMWAVRPVRLSPGDSSVTTRPQARSALVFVGDQAGRSRAGSHGPSPP